MQVIDLPPLQATAHRLTAEEVLPLVYGKLRQLARCRLSRELPGQTLQATALVHEVYLKLSGGDQQAQWQNSHHFFAAAALTMKRILIDRARAQQSMKRGGEWRRIDWIDVPDAATNSLEDLLDLDQALERLETRSAPAAEVARLRLFTGLTIDETALALELSHTTTHRYWAYARAFLQHELKPK
jgi:RNA polymerase sigma factor (TIGR02999 family)